ncbi:hypothetical protein [Ralstonia solanacearum]|uniref:hypothetical protein n=1 Tax=Ralstonia solanacearum TaxID=305 RepID=UPI0013C31793|nr:hypothetical protein [Ralstonia solanacearum]
MPNRRSQEEQAKGYASAAEKEGSVAYLFPKPEFPNQLKRRTSKEKHDEADCKSEPIVSFAYAFVHTELKLRRPQLKTAGIVGVLRVVVPMKIVENVHFRSARVQYRFSGSSMEIFSTKSGLKQWSLLRVRSTLRLCTVAPDPSIGSVRSG